MKSLLELKEFRKEYKNRDASLEVLKIPLLILQKGQQVALIGHSGSGKTTLLNTIAGLSMPTEGKVMINGQDIYGLNEAQRDIFRVMNIGYIFQNFNLVPSLTALENILLPMYFVGTMPKKNQLRFAKELLAQVKLENRLYHKLGELSRGEQQRVAVARAMANKGNIILADEPTGNVDLNNGRIILELIKNMCQEHNAALLLVTHNPYVVETFNEVWDMEKINHAAIMTERSEKIG
ncbi:ABC transporter ATP-binding protein [Candidatus Contubernalis alkaliaceticus]|uniref:ABC transporter ATP-binding protein n=1 Tax=Candidatus Contubernalis alkaliaceticus TaxID=338645 RepID=UPI001F4C4839|nr:ABC transporter ATP-binding protein [Candidatus Contubernalis alkalaceticus]UNC92920.1 ABC transporter ATP-binding protein [Candidatus Contubernalis alkalaceticus]